MLLHAWFTSFSPTVILVPAFALSRLLMESRQKATLEEIEAKDFVFDIRAAIYSRYLGVADVLS